MRKGLCSLAQPCLRHPQHAPQFLFQDATLLLVASGRLEIIDGANKISIDSPLNLLLVEANTRSDLQKSPGDAESRFRSIFLSFLPDLLSTFQSGRDPVDRTSAVHQVALDDELAETLHYVLESIYGSAVSDERLRYRLLDLLAAISERGHRFARVPQSGVVARLRTMVGEAPERRWTAKDAAHALATSEATLRRRLADEGAHFEDMLMDVRMHHALMLMQTTSWSIPRIAEASGYKSRTRFAERFRERFGYAPSSVR